MGGDCRRGGGECSGWWRMLCNIRGRLREGVGNWFEGNICRVVGDGWNTFFWLDHWVGESPLRYKFPRLFDLALNKECSVEEMGRAGWGGRRRGVFVEASVVSMGGGKCEGVFIIIT